MFSAFWRSFWIALCLLSGYALELSANSTEEFRSKLPTVAFNPMLERELVAVLSRMKAQIAHDKNSLQPENVQLALAQGLASLGQREAFGLVPEPNHSAVAQQLAWRWILENKTAEAATLLPHMNPTERAEIQIELAKAALGTPKAPLETQKWARAAIETAPRTLDAELSSLWTQEEAQLFREGLLVLPARAAQILAMAGAGEEAEERFQEFEAQASQVSVLSEIFKARFRGGLREQASQMLKRKPFLRPSVVTFLAQEGQIDLAVQEAHKIKGQMAFEALVGQLKFLSEAPAQRARLDAQLKTLWAALPPHERDKQRDSYARELFRSGLAKEAESLVRRELRGAALTTALDDLAWEFAFEAPYQKPSRWGWTSVELEHWRDRAATVVMRRALRDDTAIEVIVQYDVPRLIALERPEKARAALFHAERKRLKKESFQPGVFETLRSQAYRGLGDSARASAIEKRLMARFDLSSLLSIAASYRQHDLVRGILLSPRFTDSERVAVALHRYFTPANSVPRWLYQIPDAPTRAATFAAFAQAQIPAYELPN